MPAADNILPDSVPRDEASVEAERKVREQFEVLREQMKEHIARNENPPEDGGILPIDPAGDADRKRLWDAWKALEERVSRLEDAVLR